MSGTWNGHESDKWVAMTPEDMRNISARRLELADKSVKPDQDALFGECMRLALAHADAGTENAPSYSALLAQVRQWLRAKGAAVDEDEVNSEARTFVMAVYAW